MFNHGNTCFFNAVMQCLTHTVPFRQFCLNGDHLRTCKRGEAHKQNCYLCKYSLFIQGLVKQEKTNPLPIVRSLPSIWRGYRVGQQKDSHEFLSIYLEALLNSSFEQKPSRSHVIKNQSQTPLFKIFGSKMRSQINCQKCNYKSDTYDETFTLNLPLPRGQNATFGHALMQYFSVDKLEKDNKYMCSSCKSL